MRTDEHQVDMLGDHSYPLLMGQKCLKLVEGCLLSGDVERAQELLVMGMKWLLDVQMIVGKKSWEDRERG